MSICRGRWAVLSLGLAMVLPEAMLSPQALRAQLIPLLPPIAGEGPDEATQQPSKATQTIREDLATEKFDELDQIADRYRQKKLRVSGGGWRLRQFYTALDPQQPSDAATEEHMQHIEHWIAAKPDSITARVALAKSYHHWAWLARGSGTSDTVTPAMAKLFFARIEMEEDVLKKAEKLPVMCPEWYSEMMTVGLAEGWDNKKMQALLDRAVAFEPGYLYYYREYANYLLPKWEGHPGDAAEFAQIEAHTVGGDMGDLIYFEVATVVIKRGNGGIPTEEMDWQRIKRGAQVLDRENGHSKQTMNQLAFMAYKYKDAATAAPLFLALGDRWGTGVWGSHGNYEKARLWAVKNAGATKPGDAPRPLDPAPSE